MKATEVQLAVIKRVATSADGLILINFYKDLIRWHADVRRIQANPTLEDIKARQIVCDILEEELVSRFTRGQPNDKPIIENYE